MDSKDANQSMKASVKTNLRVVAGILALCTLLVSCRLTEIQLINSDKYKRSATYSQWSEEIIPATRGTIYDANGNIIAQSASTWKVYLIPENFKDEDFRKQVCRDFADVLDLDYDELMEITETEEVTDEDELVIAHKKDVKTQMELPEKQLVDCDKESSEESCSCLKHRKYSKQVKNDDGELVTKTYKYSDIMGLENDSKRYYPMGSFASSVVGFVDSDGNGVSGIERYCNASLAGTDGRKTSYASNVDDSNTNYNDAKDGNSIKLTIDETVQYCLDEQLNEVYESSGALGAYGIVMEVDTGAILGMDCVGYKGSYDLTDPYEINEYYQEQLDNATSSDNFDLLDKYVKGSKEDEEEVKIIKDTSSFEERKALHDKKLKYFLMMEQWNNYTVSETYHPGSVFKIFVSAAAIEEKVLGDDFTYCCGGSIRIDDRTFNCHKYSGHGTQTLRQGLMNSCNPFFIKVGQTLGAEKFFEYFKAFGFTEKTGIESLEESSPIYFGEDELTRVSLASESFGQTFSITPIQMITAISCIANGGYLMQPYLVAEQYSSDGNVISRTEPTVRRQVISEETAAEVASMMEDVVNSGTGKNGYVAGYRVAGKTGTTQKYQLKGTYIASFGCFAPADDPDIAVLIVVDEPQTDMNGSTVCAPVAAKVVDTVLEYRGVERQYTDEELQKLDKTVPGVVGYSAEKAKSTVEATGLNVRVIGDGDVVFSQCPSGGQTLPSNGVVALYTTKDEESKLMVTVPDFTGMSANGVKGYASSEGLNIKIVGNTGSGMVSYDQSEEAGTQVEYGTTITVYFKSYEDIGDGDGEQINTD